MKMGKKVHSKVLRHMLAGGQHGRKRQKDPEFGASLGLDYVTLSQARQGKMKENSEFSLLRKLHKRTLNGATFV